MAALPEELAELLQCSISFEYMSDAVITPCGHTFSDKAIRACLKTRKECPECRAKLAPKGLTPNFHVRNLINHLLRLAKDGASFKKSSDLSGATATASDPLAAGITPSSPTGSTASEALIPPQWVQQASISSLESWILSAAKAAISPKEDLAVTQRAHDLSQAVLEKMKVFMNVARGGDSVTAISPEDLERLTTTLRSLDRSRSQAKSAVRGYTRQQSMLEVAVSQLDASSPEASNVQEQLDTVKKQRAAKAEEVENLEKQLASITAELETVRDVISQQDSVSQTNKHAIAIAQDDLTIAEERYAAAKAALDKAKEAYNGASVNDVKALDTVQTALKPIAELAKASSDQLWLHTKWASVQSTSSSSSVPAPPEEVEKTVSQIRAESAKRRGNTAFSAKKFKVAEDEYSRAIEILAPQVSAVLHLNRAAARSGLQKWLLAIADCEHALNLEPDNIKAWRRLAYAHIRQKSWRSALEALTKASDLDPMDPKTKEMMAEVERFVGGGR